jgi:hypothetical protein
MIHYCTYFDRNYLTRAMALHRSLVRHSPVFTLWALCFDDDAYAALEALQLDGVQPIRLAEIEAADPELLETKDSRTTIEYYFTSTPSLIRFVVGKVGREQTVTYLDADLLFFSDPTPIFDELGDGSILIVPHRFPANLRDREKYGRYNVGLLTFRNDQSGCACLEKWRTQCLDWCYDRVEEDRFADQKYLDAWPQDFPGLRILANPGAGIAPWNFAQYRIDTRSGAILIDGRALVFYHFHAVRRVRRWLWDLGLAGYGSMPLRARHAIYKPYVRELQLSEQQLLRSSVPWAVGDREELRHPNAGRRALVSRFARGWMMATIGPVAL